MDKYWILNIWGELSTWVWEETLKVGRNQENMISWTIRLFKKTVSNMTKKLDKVRTGD